MCFAKIIMALNMRYGPFITYSDRDLKLPKHDLWRLSVILAFCICFCLTGSRLAPPYSFLSFSSDLKQRAKTF